MKKTELQNLSTGNKVINKKDNTILEIVAMENSKYILSNGKCYSQSTMYRWFDLQVEEVEQPEQPKEVVEDKTVQPKFKLGDTVKNGLGQIGEVVSVPHLVSYNGRLVMDGYRVRFTEDGETFIKSYSETYEGLTKVEKPVEPIKPTNTSEKVVANENHEDHTVEANSKVVEGENTIEQIIQEYKCHTQKMQQYTAVKSDNTKKTLVYIRVAKEGGYHFDISQKTWHKLNKAYANWLTTNFNAGIKDKTRKLYRVSCNDLKIFRNLLLVALS